VGTPAFSEQPELSAVSWQTLHSTILAGCLGKALALTLTHTCGKNVSMGSKARMCIRYV